MRTLITGGAGYIGSHAVRCFRQRGHDVWVLDNLSNGHRSVVPREILVEGDVGDADLAEHLLRRHGIEAVVHFAAFAYVGESVTDPGRYYQNNLVNTLHLLEAMRRAGVWRMVFSSTCATYGIPETTPIAEAAPQMPVNPYGRAKLAVEWALGDYARAYGFGYAALRYFNAAGASPAGDLGEHHEPETHLIPLALQAALGVRPFITIHGDDYPTPDGTCIRDYVHVDDLADAHEIALGKLQPGVGLHYNLGIGKGYSVREVIASCAEVSGRTIATQIGPRRAGDPPILVADPTLAEQELGWRPRYRDLRSIVASAWNWHRRHPQGHSGCVAARAELKR